jgi:quinol-cytochrome oxidoreductase complex cytochrome b subunit
MRVLLQNILLKVGYGTAVIYPAPINLTYVWTFGVYAIICLMIQLLTGIFLVMHYSSDQTVAFLSVEHIMRDVNYGWLLRYMHANGASMFFIVVYIHIFRGVYYTSYAYPRQHLWSVGVAIFFLMIMTAFLGYVLPWGQMSFWAATVITNLVSAIPKVGSDIVVWLWGGYAVDNATLTRFFSLHYLMPFVILALVMVHIIYLHEHKSNNPLGVKFNLDGIYFYPYTIVKDIFGTILFLMFFAMFLFFMPNVLGHPDNYIPANPLVTPAHIVPEWYFLPFYAILRAIPDKLGGVIAMLASILCLFALPIVSKPEVKSMAFRPLSKVFFWLIIADGVLLGWLGSKSVEYPYIEVGQLATCFYFLYFLLISPTLAFIEKIIWSNEFYLNKFDSIKK